MAMTSNIVTGVSVIILFLVHTVELGKASNLIPGGSSVNEIKCVVAEMHLLTCLEQNTELTSKEMKNDDLDVIILKMCPDQHSARSCLNDYLRGTASCLTPQEMFSIKNLRRKMEQLCANKKFSPKFRYFY